MKRRLIHALAAVIALAAFGITIGCNPTPDSNAPAAAGKKTLYTCGMHPNVIQDSPGLCPICEMKLTALRRDGGGASPSATAISIDPVTIQNMAIRTAVLTNGPLRRVIRTVASIEYAEPDVADVTTKYKGWVEKLYVDAVGAQVHRGDPLFEVYSPELYSAQTDYLLALQAGSGTGADALRETARAKLKYWDISDAQIAELESTRTAQKTLKVLAPIDGFVTEKTVVEGQMVDTGMRLYRIADLGLVWVQAQIYEQDLPFVRLGQEAIVSLSYLPDRKFRGRITYIYPNLDPKTRTAQVRMEFHNPGYFLKPGMFASVEVISEISRSALLVPDMAILRSGTKNTVFVAVEDGKFEPRTVTLGARADEDMIQVLSGLEAGERVVTSGQFMLDSESQLREAIQKMLNPPAPGSHAGHAYTAPVTTASGREAASTQPGEVSYLCPMPEHVAIEYDHPGDCPLCGMALVPVTKEALAKIQPGGVVDHYTCPMPEHAEVKLDTPGKCPRCRMTLIPVMPDPPETDAAVARLEAPLTQLYTCPMAVCQTVTDQPGRCPECEMKLVPTSTVAHGKEAEAQWLQDHPPAAVEPPDTALRELYSCPMHPAVKQSQPGRCPICEMALTLVTGALENSVPGEPVPPAGVPTLYTCPMASHAHIVSDQPGKCPECEMKLVETGEVEHQKKAEEQWRKQRTATPTHQH